jgi:hypothetical protein
MRKSLYICAVKTASSSKLTKKDVVAIMKNHNLHIFGNVMFIALLSASWIMFENAIISSGETLNIHEII